MSGVEIELALGAEQAGANEEASRSHAVELSTPVQVLEQPTAALVATFATQSAGEESMEEDSMEENVRAQIMPEETPSLFTISTTIFDSTQGMTNDGDADPSKSPIILITSQEIRQLAVTTAISPSPFPSPLPSPAPSPKASEEPSVGTTALHSTSVPKLAPSASNSVNTTRVLISPLPSPSIVAATAVPPSSNTFVRSNSGVGSAPILSAAHVSTGSAPPTPVFSPNATPILVPSKTPPLTLPSSFPNVPPLLITSKTPPVAAMTPHRRSKPVPPPFAKQGHIISRIIQEKKNGVFVFVCVACCVALCVVLCMCVVSV